jgi:hypothetical protein
MKLFDRATEECRRGHHEDPEETGMCCHCSVILNPEPDEDPNDLRRYYGWPSMPTSPIDDEKGKS